MRIVGGTWRGRALETVAGRDVTRPTTDRMRESLASMVMSAFGLDLSEVSVLDAFAGSGALGLEMLSRGAARCTFMESDRAALACVRANARSLGLSREHAEVLRGDAFRLCQRRDLPGSPFALVLLDPPYAYDARRVADLVADLARAGSLAPDALVLYERASGAAGLDLPQARLLSTKSHAATAVDLMRLGCDDGA